MDLLTAQAAPQTGDANRTELLRSEVVENPGGTGFVYMSDPNDATFPATEVVAEYAIDLNVSATIRTNPNSTPVTLQRLDGDNATDDSGFTGANTNSEEYMSLGVRLSTRARAPDRD